MVYSYCPSLYKQLANRPEKQLDKEWITMKFCPYCGASLPGGAASFCPECGKSLRIEKAAGTRRRKKRPPQQKSRQAPHHRSRPINPMDVNYDGYYDDIQPIDSGARGEGMDPELVKQIALVILGAVGAIILAVTLMMLL